MSPVHPKTPTMKSSQSTKGRLSRPSPVRSIHPSIHHPSAASSTAGHVGTDVLLCEGCSLWVCACGLAVSCTSLHRPEQAAVAEQIVFERYVLTCTWRQESMSDQSKICVAL